MDKANWHRGLESVNCDEFTETYEELKALNKEFESGSLQHIQNTCIYCYFKNLLEQYQPKYSKLP